MTFPNVSYQRLESQDSTPPSDTQPRSRLRTVCRVVGGAVVGGVVVATVVGFGISILHLINSSETPETMQHSVYYLPEQNFHQVTSGNETSVINLYCPEQNSINMTTACENLWQCLRTWVSNTTECLVQNVCDRNITIMGDVPTFSEGSVSLNETASISSENCTRIFPRDN